VNSWLQDDTRIAAVRLSEALGHHARPASDAVAQLAGHIAAFTPDGARAQAMAQATLSHTITREALTMGFNDVFRLMAFMFIAALVLVPFCRPAASPPPADAAAH